jgi:membrane protein implicated in regulation of membrane protease activity
MMVLVWGAICVAFIVGELHTTAGLAVFGAIGAGAAGAAALLGGPVAVQIAVFLAVTLAGLAFARRLIKPYLARMRAQRWISGVEGLVGELGIVMSEVGDEALPGRVRVRGDTWLAVTWEPSPLPPETIVRVVAVEEGRLVVAKEDRRVGGGR